jgi:hypothetical protein
MGVDILKKRLLERIEQGGEQYIRILSAVSDALEAMPKKEINDDIIGYNIATNEPLLASKVDETFEAIVDDVKKGNFIEVDELIAQKSARW